MQKGKRLLVNNQMSLKTKLCNLLVKHSVSAKEREKVAYNRICLWPNSVVQRFDMFVSYFTLFLRVLFIVLNSQGYNSWLKQELFVLRFFANYRPTPRINYRVIKIWVKRWINATCCIWPYSSLRIAICRRIWRASFSHQFDNRHSSSFQSETYRLGTLFIQ